MMTISPRRTFLLLPGHETRKAAKAATLPVDAVIFDIEDGVPQSYKQAARQEIARSVSEFEFGPREIMVRINAISTSDWREDVAAIAGLTLAGIYLPKVESAAEVATFWEHLAKAAPALTTCAVFVTIETALGLTRVEEIAAAPGLAGLFFGSGDYSLSTGIEISPDTLLYPRSRIAVAAAAHGLLAVDVAYFRDVKDAVAAEEDARQARALGFAAKVVFHPNQVDVVNAVFTPNADEIAHARRILSAYEVSRESGQGVLLLDGDFVAIDIARMAERTLARAASTGAITVSSR
jgi:citrate lyase beta subunit